MQYETKKRSFLKAISWRTWATITTAIIVFLFTGELTLALTVGLLEVTAKMGLYFFHERMWHKITWGKKEVPSFVLWFTGLPASGKKEIGDRVFQELKQQKLKVERLDSKDVRPLFPEVGFSPDEVNRHVKRAGHLCAMLEKNGIIVVASFVSPYRNSRLAARSMAQHFVEVYLRSTVEACEARDEKGHYAKARRGEYRFFPGVDVAYGEPEKAEIVIDVDHVCPEKAALQIVEYLKRNILFGGSGRRTSVAAGAPAARYGEV
ncbi:MAG: adenylyl-sulfate kinase [Desulfuromonadales bacterium]|nr:adenylyl-sulfate kinase [Desulfuromonadales bacterium]